MALRLSKRKFMGQVYAGSIGIILLISAAGFFDVLAQRSSSDYANNINSIIAASQGSYWSGANSPSGILGFMRELHFYFWLGILGSIFEDKENILRILTLSVTFLLTYPTLYSASQLRNKHLLALVLFVLFSHPRFFDLVISNVRSAVALTLVFYALRVNGFKLRFVMMTAATTFHFSALGLIFLYLLYLFCKRLPKNLTGSGALLFLAVMAPGLFVLVASIVFPERGGGNWEGGILYSTAIYLLSAYTFFIGSKKVDNEYVFISLGLLALVVWGSLLGYATMRFFSFFFPIFAVMMLTYHRQPQVLLLSFSVWGLFTILSHSYWISAP